MLIHRIVTFLGWLIRQFPRDKRSKSNIKQSSIMLEELKFVSISDYDYTITSPKISVFGDTAVAAFELNQRGMLVDNKAFTGEHISINGRATFVLLKKPTWKIIHIHLSRIKN